MKSIIIWFLSFFLVPMVRAHCPLCTVGAVVAAGGASYFGVSQAIIGIFIGAFAVSVGWMIANWLKKYWLRWPLIIISYITTVWPMLGLMNEVRPLYISWIGSYGTTLVVPSFLVGSVVGGVMVCIAPTLSKFIARKRGTLVPFQGVALTFILLAVSSIVIEVVL
jgi:hypothetical protein